MTISIMNFTDLEDGDKHGLLQAFYAARRSRDPRTKVGAVGKIGSRISDGYNRFPHGIIENYRLQDQDVKNLLMIHAEMDLLANFKGEPPDVVWVTKAPCVNCAKTLIHNGVVKAVFPLPERDGSWYRDQRFAVEMFREAGTEIIQVIIREGDLK